MSLKGLLTLAMGAGCAGPPVRSARPMAMAIASRAAPIAAMRNAVIFMEPPKHRDWALWPLSCLYLVSGWPLAGLNPSREGCCTIVTMIRCAGLRQQNATIRRYQGTKRIFAARNAAQG
jgi:hypothetical protein